MVEWNSYNKLTGFFASVTILFMAWKNVDFTDEFFKKLFKPERWAEVYEKSKVITPEKPRQVFDSKPKIKVNDIKSSLDYFKNALDGSSSTSVPVEMDFPLWFGREMLIRSNPVMSYIHAAWKNRDTRQFGVIYQALAIWQLGLNTSNMSFRVGVNGGQYKCHLVHFETYDFDKVMTANDMITGNGVLNNLTPFKLRLKIFSEVANVGEWIHKGGYFYITGDVAIEDDKISEFEVDTLNYLDNTSTLSQSQILLEKK